MGIVLDYLRGYARATRRRVELKIAGPNGEYAKLDELERPVIDRLAELARERGCRQDYTFADGSDAYAYPAGGGRISWGRNTARGENVLRGIIPAEQEAAS